jgi:hypothetical protein
MTCTISRIFAAIRRFIFRLIKFTANHKRTQQEPVFAVYAEICSNGQGRQRGNPLFAYMPSYRKEVKRVKRLKKAYEITDAKIQFVSLVDKAANKRKFLMTKAEDGKAVFTTYGRIVKSDTDSHFVTGIVYEPMVEDAHGNFMSEEEITKAAYWYAKNGDKVDLQHSFEPLGNACVVESWIAKADFEINGESIKKGTWLMTVEVTDEDVWTGIEKGEITGFSMGGVGNYSEEDTDLNSIEKQQEPEKKGLLMQLAKALGLSVVEKGEVAELYEERIKSDNFWTAFYALEDVLRRYDYFDDKVVWQGDEETVKTALQDFSNIIQKLLTGGQSITKTIYGDNQTIVKSGKAMSSKNKEMLQGIYDSLGTFLAAFNEEPENPETVEKAEIEKEESEMTKEEVEQIVSTAIAKAMQPAGQVEQQPEAQVVEKQEGAEAITAESIEKMVSAAIEKAMRPKEEPVSMEQVQEMITKAVESAIAPVMKVKGLPTNIGNGRVEKQQEEIHYLHGIL